MIRKSKKVVPGIGPFYLNVTVCGHTKKQEIKILNINKDLVNTLRVGSADIKFQENCTLQTYFNLFLESSFKYRTVERANVVSECANMDCEPDLWTWTTILAYGTYERYLWTCPANFDFCPESSFKCRTVRSSNWQRKILFELSILRIAIQFQILSWHWYRLEARALFSGHASLRE